ncbi:GerAB/ArcD/ProY family transporter [Clostridium thailandense]|uniref:GerAB/ArcD/ProY family transporter n=1 Tax=Clostridium thailandense TaxID=2794346 RepID=UPI003988F0BB
MDKDTDSLLTPSQLTFILIGSILGVALLSLPNYVTKYAKQDGWISCTLGVLYPIYMVFIADYLYQKHPKDNILKLSKKYLGKFLGTILNIIFISYFCFLATEIASGISNVLRIHMTYFITNYKLLSVLFLAPAFIAYKGIKTLGKVNELFFYLTISIVFIPIAVLKYGLLVNLMPVFGSGIINIIKSTGETVYAYCGIEILFLIYPYLQNGNSLKKAGLKSAIIIMIIYMWFTFMVIYYLGVDIIPKFLWSTIITSEAIKLPVINNFRYIFMVLFSFIMLKSIANHYYSLTYGLSELTSIAKRKTFVFLVYPLLFYVSSKYGNPTLRRDLVDKITPIYVTFNFVYVSIISLILHIKKGDKNV